MESLVKVFLERNTGKRKIILLGEEHAGENLIETVGKQIAVLNTLDAEGIDYVFYSEISYDMISLLNNKFTAFYLKKEIEARGKKFSASKVTQTCRSKLGTCDDLYEVNVQSYSTGDKVVVAAVGLLHAAGMNFPSEIALLRLNCASTATTKFAISELQRTGNREFAAIIEETTPYIEDDTSIPLGRAIISKYLGAVAGAGAGAVAGGAGAVAGGTFIPIFKKSEYGECVAQCPECGNMTGSSLDFSGIHALTCSNKYKIPDFSQKDEKCAEVLRTTGGGGAGAGAGAKEGACAIQGGGRRRQTRHRKRRSHRRKRSTV
jgi:hypothetical protein